MKNTENNALKYTSDRFDCFFRTDTYVRSSPTYYVFFIANSVQLTRVELQTSHRRPSHRYARVNLLPRTSTIFCSKI